MIRLPDGLGELHGAARLGGGSIAEVHTGRLSGGRRVVVKQTPYDARLEAEGLRALGTAGAPVPEVLGVDPAVLVLEHVAGPPDWHGLGRAVATFHGTTADRFGWQRDNVIGPLPQTNGWTERWGRFYLEHRLRPHLDALPVVLRRRIENATDAIAGLLDRGAAPSLIHGDLWSGNIVDGRHLVDPAVCYADRELDLAFLEMFGSVPDAFHEGYHRVWPLDPGWERRRGVLQLYHLLVHVVLFGESYLPPVEERLDAMGW